MRKTSLVQIEDRWDTKWPSIDRQLVFMFMQEIRASLVPQTGTVRFNEIFPQCGDTRLENKSLLFLFPRGFKRSFIPVTLQEEKASLDASNQLLWCFLRLDHQAG